MRSLVLAVLAVVPLTLVLSMPAAADCAAITKALTGIVTDLTCLESTDLTTRNDATTPPDNSRPGLPPNAFTPRTDAQAVSPDAPFRTAIDPSRTVPGLHITGAMPDDANAPWPLPLPAAAELAIEAHYDRAPERVYLMGISNGGHVVRRLLAEAPTRFDGGLDWEGVFWSTGGPNILIDLPVALRNWDGYVTSGLSATSPASLAIRAAGYPPDIRATPPTPANTFSPLVGSLWETHANNYWDVTTCVFVRLVDPLYPVNQLDPLAASDTKDYDYLARRKPFHLSPRVGQVATDGDIARPLITVQGTMDTLLPIVHHARALRDAVVTAGRASLHRYYEVQNGNHIERYRQTCCNFVQLEFIQPHAHRAFQLLLDWVERGVSPPASQCIPRGGAIVSDPAAAARPERCASLLVE